METTLPSDLLGQVDFIKKERSQVIQALAQQSKKLGKVIGPSDDSNKALLPRLDTLLTWLENDVQMSRELYVKTKIDNGMKLIFMPNNNGFSFSQSDMERARRLSETWEDQVGLAIQPNQLLTGQKRKQHDDNERQWGAPSVRRQSDGASGGTITPPPLDHPIWGINGIMHGLALKKGRDGRKSTVLNPEYAEDKRDGKVFGHNGLQVGTWFPNRISALFYGAHSASQAGICGSAAQGAYSIVVSGLYHLLDTDRGETLYYSGSGSHDNENPNQPADPTEGTKALDKSKDTGRAVRVLRTSEGQSHYAPGEGIRYDGLYVVVDKRYPRNSKNGKYEQFELKRVVDGQISLNDCKSQPNSQQLRDYDKIKDGYSSRR